jgi:hypothetical protein
MNCDAHALRATPMMIPVPTRAPMRESTSCMTRGRSAPNAMRMPISAAKQHAEENWNGLSCCVGHATTLLTGRPNARASPAARDAPFDDQNLQKMVARDRIELSTLRFSVVCSTN